ncbi:MAG TPA: hypothetical protein VF779_14840 [Pyrinomonadaceae bacterium]
MKYGVGNGPGMASDHRTNSGGCGLHHLRLAVAPLPPHDCPQKGSESEGRAPTLESLSAESPPGNACWLLIVGSVIL